MRVKTALVKGQYVTIEQSNLAVGQNIPGRVRTLQINFKKEKNQDFFSASGGLSITYATANPITARTIT